MPGISSQENEKTQNQTSNVAEKDKVVDQTEETVTTDVNVLAPSTSKTTTEKDIVEQAQKQKQCESQTKQVDAKSPKKIAGMTVETLKRLTRIPPKKEPAELFSECTFAPKICEKSLDLTKNRPNFHQRVDKEVKNHRVKMLARMNAKAPYPFSPKITKLTPDQEHKIEWRGDFLTRAQDDMDARKSKRKAMTRASKKAFSFTPSITKSPNGVEVRGEFLERLQIDIDNRKSRSATFTQDPECKFSPELSKQTHKIFRKNGSAKFIDRMQDDLDNRRAKAGKIQAELRKPAKFKRSYKSIDGQQLQKK
mmetsp:Transcript_15937/g.28582  ORF Transcript_15937/g.28582 Transcript_15937/m.28582 type:complete len:308 (+) Transcript_15937:118-1041(+)|eukprot:CAMPEP_0197529790 /NCGR_PEP_ID=MMETSP1318-20131121/29647_1 /TAXON_ID=552666 /ORGANISM="Partenskyella glossopodia, Strain RCC365" /LENGTH=307 /DNA_ID=CAMNT_0043085389 /DNA_START=10 /DNA_END=933 /DNA_ORIENTATION=-